MEILVSLLVAVLVGATLQRLSGTGVGLVLAPTLTVLLGPAQGVLITNGVTMLSGLMIMLAVRRDIDWRKVAIIVPAAAAGAVPGALLVRELPAAWLQIGVGLVVLMALVTTFALPNLPYVGSRVEQVIAGMIGGLCNTTAGVAGPAMVVHARLSRWEQRSFQASLQPIFMMMGLISVVSKTALGSFQSSVLPPWWIVPTAVVATGAGIALGRVLSRAVPASRARLMAIGLAGAGGVVAILRGIWALTP